MNYIVPVAIVFCFCFLGFLLYTICSGRSETDESLRIRNSALKDEIKQKEITLRSLQEEIVETNERIRSLIRQLREKNKELDDLRQGVYLREEKIALLDKTVRDSLGIISNSVDPSNGNQFQEAREKTDIGNTALRVQKLREILQLLDSMNKP